MANSILSLGTGNMGAAIARALLPSHSLTIWNRTSSRPQVKALIEEGAKFEPSLPVAVTAASTILICVTEYATISEIMADIAAGEGKQIWKGKTILNLTNGTPRDAQQLGETFTQLGAAAYFDGAVMVTPQLVGTPHSFVIVSGESVERLKHSGVAGLLEKIGKVQYVGEDVQHAARLDVAALTSMYGMFNGAFVGFGLMKRQKDAGKILDGVESVMVPLMAALVPYLGHLAKGMDDEAWHEDLGSPAGMQLAGLRNILRACEEEGVDAGGMKYFVDLMERVVKENGADGGISVLGTYLLE